MAKKRDLDKVEQQLKAILGTGKFLVMCHHKEQTQIFQGETATYEAYGLMRLAETFLDLQTCDIMRRAAKEEQKRIDDTSSDALPSGIADPAKDSSEDVAQS